MTAGRRGLRVGVVADLHGHLPEAPRCDLLLLGGDLCPLGMRDTEDQREWLDTTFRTWLELQPVSRIVGIAGNHDFVFERAPESVPDDLPWTYLEGTRCVIDGLTIWGSPWTPWFHSWAFNAPRERSEDFLREHYARVGDDVDVLLIHGPPAGYGDRVEAGDRVGSVAELELVDRVAPALCAFGHIHEGRGSWSRGDTRLLNAAAVDPSWVPRPEPVVVLEI